MRVARDGAVVVWTLARPQAKNALDAATMGALVEAIAQAGADPTLRAVVLTAEGDTFAAGGDLRELRGRTSEEDALALANAGRAVCDGLGALPVPVIAALPGAAIGGGAELAFACDLRVADPRASLCFKHARMGVSTAWGVLPRLFATAGAATTSRLLLTAQTIGAAEALRLGLVDAVSEEGGCVELARAWARDVERGAPGAVAEMKALVRHAVKGHALRAHELERFSASWSSADHAEAVEAFFESRPPRWTGTPAKTNG